MLCCVFLIDCCNGALSPPHLHPSPPPIYSGAASSLHITRAVKGWIGRNIKPVFPSWRGIITVFAQFKHLKPMNLHFLSEKI